jgi:hypothetical protein
MFTNCLRGSIAARIRSKDAYEALETLRAKDQLKPLKIAVARQAGCSAELQRPLGRFYGFRG